MVIAMKMDTGRILRIVRVDDPDPAGGYDKDGYGDEVLNAGWAEVPRIAPRMEEVATARADSHETPSSLDVDAFMSRLYACQE